MRQLEKIFAVAKEDGFTRTIPDLGTFDTEERQMAYLRYYVPEWFLKPATGRS